MIPSQLLGTFDFFDKNRVKFQIWLSEPLTTTNLVMISFKKRVKIYFLGTITPPQRVLCVPVNLKVTYDGFEFTNFWVCTFWSQISSSLGWGPLSSTLKKTAIREIVMEIEEIFSHVTLWQHSPSIIIVPPLPKSWNRQFKQYEGRIRQILLDLH